MYPENEPVRERINQPATKSGKTWDDFDEDVEAMPCGNISQRLEALQTIIHIYGKEAFGTDEWKSEQRRIATNKN